MVMPVLDRRLEELGARFEGTHPRLSERDALLITYGDMLGGRGGSNDPAVAESALHRVASFANRYLGDAFSLVHVLPFFPSSSDDGFSVMDYRRVDPELGDWDDIGMMGRSFGLAFDLVLNHASAQGKWFNAFLAGEPPYDHWFITRPRNYDYSSVVRPRLHPLLTPFTRKDGSKAYVWTTFSADQADLDFSRPELLAEFVDIFLEYVARGARILRLDAIAYLWKEDGHACIHHPKTHLVVKLFRAVSELIDPSVIILTETNVPHEDNIAYFGDGDEAHMVYNFALPPLTLHSFITGGAGALSRWAAGLFSQGSNGLFLNFLSSHDGIGVMPARGILGRADLDRIVGTVRARGGLVSERATAEGPVPYELNSTWLDAIADPRLPRAERAGALLSSHAIMLALAGLPAIYFHSLVGSENWKEGVRTLGMARAINRQKLEARDLEEELSEPETLRSIVFRGILALLAARSARPAFAPEAPQFVLSSDGSGSLLSGDAAKSGTGDDGPFFALVRGLGEGAVLCVVNVSEREARFNLPKGFFPRGAPFDPTVRLAKSSSEEEMPDISRPWMEVPPRSTRWLDGSMKGD